MYAIKKLILKFITTPERVFLVLALVFGVVSAIIVPQLSVTDEQMHFLRAYSLSSGQINTERCTYPDEVLSKVSESEEGVFNKDFFLKNASPGESALTETTCGSAGSYNPILHVPQAIGILLAKMVHPSADTMVLLGRIMNVLFYSIFLYFVVKHAKIGKWPIVAIGLLPSMIHLAGSLSGDAINNAVVIGFTSIVLSMAVQKNPISNRQLALLAGITLLLSATKLPNALLVGLVLLLPAPLLFIKNKIANKIHPIVLRFVLAFSIGAIFIIGVLVWKFAHPAPLVSVAPDNPLVERPWHFLRILFNTYVEPFIGYNNLVLEGVTDFFSSFRYSLPDFVVYLSWGLIFYSLLIKERIDTLVSNKRVIALASISFAILSGLIISITYALYTAWAILPFRLGPNALYADGVQGRYFTAFLTLLIPFFVLVRRYLYIKPKNEYVTGGIIVILSLFILIFYSLQSYFFSLTL